ncbi:MAG: motility associated factor glycosyltransferase family protein [Bacillota bacterium]
MTASTDSSTRFILPETSLLLANLAALWAADPGLAAALEPILATEPYPVELSKAGLPTIALPDASGRRIYLHSRYQPVDEAKRLADTVDFDEKTAFCVHGFGLGYHVEQVFDKASGEAVIIVFEPDLRLLYTAFTHRDFSQLIQTGRLIFLTQSDRATFLLRLGTLPALISIGLAYVNHAPSKQLHPEFHRQMEVAMGEFLAYCQTSLNTLVLNGRRTSENIARNLAWYVVAPGISALKNCHAGQPAIIVSAGPSLRKNKHLLKEARGKAVLIAVQTTLQPLLDMGIEPQYTTSLDYHDISARFFEKVPANLRTELVAEPKATSRVLELYPGPMRILGNGFADQLLQEMKLEKDRLRAGATVAHLAFYLAEYMGCDPIIFVGQDLGFGDGLSYLPGTSHEDVWRPELNRFCTMEMKHWEAIARERPILRKIEDYQGRPMYTEERLFSYLQQFERDFATTPAKVIDATEGGARKRGTTVMTLAEALAKYCTQPVAGLEAASGAPGQPGNPFAYRWDLLPACIGSLKQRRSEAEQIQQIGRQTLPLLYEVRDHLEDQGRVNLAIARIDALRARMFELNNCYELVTQLSQQTEFKRFRSDRQIAAAKVSGVERQRRQVTRDIANVQAIVDAAQAFQKLMDEIIDRVGRVDPAKRREHGA